MERLVLPIPVSVNRWLGMRRGRLYKTPEAQQWTRDALLLVKNWRQRTGWRIVPAGIPVIERIWIWWPDGRKHDPDNTFKILHDTLSAVVVTDDDQIWPQVWGVAVDRTNPRMELELCVKEAEA